MMNLDEWLNWATDIIYEYNQRINKSFFYSFYEVDKFIASRVFPGKYLTLEKALKNFRYILFDFRNVYLKWAKEWYEDNLETEKFYKGQGYYDDNSERYEEWEFHNNLVSDLMIELTRAANHILEEVRKGIAYNYRLREGHLLINEDRLKLVLYREHEKETLYPVLEKFLEIRASRDFSFDNGLNNKYKDLYPFYDFS